MWGLGSGLTAAFYVVLPRNIVKDPDNPPLVVLGWGTLIAGFFLTCINQFGSEHRRLLEH